MRVFISVWLLLWPLLGLSNVAILGDSITTGAVSHPKIGFDSQRLQAILDGQTSLTADAAQQATLQSAGFGAATDGVSPRRLWFSQREYLGGFNWFGRHLFMAISSLFLDVEQFSWANLVGRKLGTPPAEILIAAENGARMKASKRQLDRVLDVTGSVGPDHLFVFFTGNDLCGPTMDFVTTTAEYEGEVVDLLNYYQRNSHFEGKKPQVWLLDPIGALQLTFSSSIQTKVVKAHGREMTCKEIHNLDPEQSLGSAGIMALIPPTPTAFCPTMLKNSTPEDQERLAAVGSRIASFREALERVARNFQKDFVDKKVPFEVHHIASTGKVVLEGVDIAEDCFHLSLDGQIKLAKAVMASVEAQPVTPSH